MEIEVQLSSRRILKARSCRRSRRSSFTNLDYQRKISHGSCFIRIATHTQPNRKSCLLEDWRRVHAKVSLPTSVAVGFQHIRQRGSLGETSASHVAYLRKSISSGATVKFPTVPTVNTSRTQFLLKHIRDFDANEQGS